jgi:hypothetical protein
MDTGGTSKTTVALAALATTALLLALVIHNWPELGRFGRYRISSPKPKTVKRSDFAALQY